MERVDTSPSNAQNKRTQSPHEAHRQKPASTHTKPPPTIPTQNPPKTHTKQDTTIYNPPDNPANLTQHPHETVLTPARSPDKTHRKPTQPMRFPPETPHAAPARATQGFEPTTAHASTSSPTTPLPAISTHIRGLFLLHQSDNLRELTSSSGGKGHPKGAFSVRCPVRRSGRLIRGPPAELPLPEEGSLTYCRAISSRPMFSRHAKRGCDFLSFRTNSRISELRRVAEDSDLPEAPRVLWRVKTWLRRAVLPKLADQQVAQGLDARPSGPKREPNEWSESRVKVTQWNPGQNATLFRDSGHPRLVL